MYPWEDDGTGVILLFFFIFYFLWGIPVIYFSRAILSVQNGTVTKNCALSIENNNRQPAVLMENYKTDV